MENLTEREQFIARQSARMAADMCAASLEKLAADPRMMRVRGDVALRAAAANAGSTLRSSLFQIRRRCGLAEPVR